MCQSKVSVTKPYGNPKIADLLVIGHDPRLQESDTEAEYVFFMDYLERELPKQKLELRKYSLARAVIDYISYLTGSRYGIESVNKLYFTNLCNEFLAHPEKKKETVLIPDDKADYGISEIGKTLQIGSFKLMLPMSLQVFYHLVKFGFVPNETEDMKRFLRKGRPDESYAMQGAYRPTEQRAFVEVCGNRYHHCEIPVIPILHVKNWQRMIEGDPYYSEMRKAIDNISVILSSGCGIS